MTKQSKLRLVGSISIALAAIGSLTSISVVRAGGADGAVYLGVNITLADLGAALLLFASRGRRSRRDTPSVPSEKSVGSKPPSS